MKKYMHTHARACNSIRTNARQCPRTHTRTETLTHPHARTQLHCEFAHAPVLANAHFKAGRCSSSREAGAVCANERATSGLGGVHALRRLLTDSDAATSADWPQQQQRMCMPAP